MDLPLPSDEVLATIQKTLVSSQHGGFVSHQLQSFDNFMSQGVRTLLLQEMPEVDVALPSPSSKHAKLRFRDVHILKPEIRDGDGDGKERVRHLLPNEALLRKLTYNAELQADIHLQVYGPSQPRTIPTACGKSKGMRGSSKSSKQHSLQEDKRRRKEEFSNISLIQDELYERVSLGKIPVMVNSSYCHLTQLPKGSPPQGNQCLFDVGGYFIIKGSEKVLISQEEFATTGFYCEQMKDEKGVVGKFPIPNGGLFSRNSLLKVNLKFCDVVEQVTGTSRQYEAPKLSVQIPFSRLDINAVILLYALGIAPGKDLMDIMCIDAESEQLIMPSLTDAEEEIYRFLSDSGDLEEDVDTAAAMKLINSKRAATAMKLIDSKLTPLPLHRCLFPDVESERGKSLLLGQIISDVLSCYLGRRCYDKERMENKRVRVSGSILYEELRRGVFNACKYMKLSLGKALLKDGNIELQKHVDPWKISDGFERAFTTGNWAISARNVGVQQPAGIAVVLDRKNPLAAISHLRQTKFQVYARAPLWEARNPSRMHNGRYCLVQSPDGEECGLVKSLAMLSYVTIGSSSDAIVRLLKDYGVSLMKDLEAMPLCELRRFSRIVLNGRWIAATEQPKQVVEFLRSLRRASKISHEVEIAGDVINREIRISCDSGRLLRPLISLQGVPQSTEGIVEYIGADEEANCSIAADVAGLRGGRAEHFTHCEIHGSLAFGLGASLVPFANHNQASRVMLQSQKICKQAIGHYTTCLQGRVDKSGQHLFYPQRPLVTTMASRLLDKDELCNGQNVIVAVCPFTGFNQEDSIILNASAVHRGLFTSMHFKAFTTTFDPEKEAMMKPADSDARRSRHKGYAKLDVEGLPPIGVNLYPGEAVFGKVSTYHTDGVLEDRSEDLRAYERGCVDRVILAQDGNENTIARVILREKRAPQTGDKFSSMHGQKGVVGLIIPEYDLPFTRQGIVPDIIINPHSFPSRRTTGQLLETCFGKLAAIRGQRCDGTAFSPRFIDAILDELHSMGYQRWGEEVLIDGATGVPIEAKIFIGSAFYQRLMKMASDQVKYRSKGARERYSQQPVDDRQKNGGIRLGEMERDCLLAHGAAINVQERLYLLSDPYQMYVCRRCCTTVSRNSRAPILKCKFCKTSQHVAEVGIPYAFKLLHEELLSMGVSMRFQTELE